jgi:hypothetical protein
MKASAWKEIVSARKAYRGYVERLGKKLPGLKQLQAALIKSRGAPSYTVENPVLYNGALDDIDKSSDIRLVLVADNPGRREQEKGRYLVGPSGKIAASFFAKHPGLDIDFQSQVIILNKTPVHSPRTLELRELCRNGGREFSDALVDSQRFMAEIIFRFHSALAPVPVWIIGYSEMKKGGVFEAFTNSLSELYRLYPVRKKEIFLFRHFSMNQFSIDLAKQIRKGEETGAALARMGSAYRQRILGW